MSSEKRNTKPTMDQLPCEKKTLSYNGILADCVCDSNTAF